MQHILQRGETLGQFIGGAGLGHAVELPQLTIVLLKAPSVATPSAPVRKPRRLMGGRWVCAFVGNIVVSSFGGKPLETLSQPLADAPSHFPLNEICVTMRSFMTN